jgi:hypothetical protein
MEGLIAAAGVSEARLKESYRSIVVDMPEKKNQKLFTGA